MRSVPLLVVAGVVALSTGSARPDEPKKKADPKSAQAKLMADKLKAAQTMLEGLATNNFDKVSKSADELMLISKTAEFMAYKTKDYELHTNDFRRSLETITKKAKEKNIDGATLGYVDMTLTCVRCHEHTREVKMAALPAPASPAGE